MGFNRSNIILLEIEKDIDVQNKPVEDILHSDELKEKYKFDMILPLTSYVEKLDINRVTFERHFLDDNPEIERTGIRHFKIPEGLGTRHKIYIDFDDFKDYIFRNFNISVNWFEDTNNSLERYTYSNRTIPLEIQEEIINLFFKDRWKSTRQLQEIFNKSRHMISRLVNVVDSVSFQFPGSQRTMRRFLLKYDNEHYANVISNYKSFEKKLNQR
ncbi:hypothetical protein GLW08_21415 [Pontibacillus yanchengensis]|uniref:Uncharacterized protein n=2 Tax=Pontibacillus yanchengensis TaxID=462910 RepID=A0ACC7VLZ8_9BACI|nr:hypothetical protein [Pontibacillus yanchengensis]MYL35444.1 hypothetical protein [Pontibacillus yanchengensis]MYL55863.1 hypothetical protein [Pontibacillus yanchengensis]